MSQKDYEAIATIIEDIIGKDTISCIKILEGIKFYLDNKVETVKVIKTETNKDYGLHVINKHSEAANKALKSFTARLVKKHGKKRKKNCATTS